MTLSRRRQPRFRYRASLRITDRNAGRAVDATCFDLSPGGMGVRASGLYEVGSDVVCELEVDGRQLALPGVVAWTVPPPANEVELEDAATSTPTPSPRARPHRRVTQGLYRLGIEGAPGEAELEAEAAREQRPDTKTLLRLGAADARETPMGIRFASLVAEQARALEDLLRDGTPLKSPVELFFAGVDAPVAARALTTEDRVQLRAGLPFLAIDSEVRVRFANGDEHEGRVQRVALGTADGMPQLEIDIAHGATQPPSDEPAAAKDIAPPRNAGAMPPITAATTAVATSASAAPRAPERPRLMLAAATLLAGAALGAAASWLFLRSSAAPLKNSARSEERVSERAPERQPPASPQPKAPAQPAQPSEAAIAAPEAAQPAEAEAEASVSGTRADTTAAPQVTVLGGATRVFIPMSGSDANISRYELISPGIVVNLPEARALIPLADYPIYRGLVRRVWLRPHKDGVQVRMVWRVGPARTKVVFEERGLTLIVRP